MGVLYESYQKNDHKKAVYDIAEAFTDEFQSFKNIFENIIRFNYSLS